MEGRPAAREPGKCTRPWAPPVAFTLAGLSAPRVLENRLASCGPSALLCTRGQRVGRAAASAWPPCFPASLRILTLIFRQGESRPASPLFYR